MPRASRVETPVHDPRVYPDDLQPALQETLAALADIDFRFEEQRQRVAAWLGPDEIRERLAEQIAQQHAMEREPYVRHLAELHHRAMATLGFGPIS